MNFFIDYFDKTDLDGKSKVGVLFALTACVLSVALVLKDVKNVVCEEGNEAGVRLVPFHTVTFA